MVVFLATVNFRHFGFSVGEVEDEEKSSVSNSHPVCHETLALFFDLPNLPEFVKTNALFDE